MTRSIALLRGVNVGGNHKLPMADLRARLTANGFGNVATYIQSGNVVLDAPVGDSSASLAARLARVIGENARFEVPVVVRSRDEWSSMFHANPYPVDDPTKVHVLFPSHGFDTAAFNTIDLAAFAPETMTITTDAVYLHLPDGMGNSKLAVAMSRVKVPTTARNWRTVLKLAELAAR